MSGQATPAAETTPRYLQLMWGVAEAVRRGPKPGLSIQEIGAAAVTIADRDGLAAVSMKAVAQSLGLTTMSLYRYVDAKDELYAVMIDVAYGRPPAGLTARGGWRTRLERWARAMAAQRLARPWTVLVPLTAPPATPNTALWTEAGLRAFDPTNVPVQQQFSALLVVDGLVQQHIRQSLLLGFLAPGGTATSGPDSYPENLFALADAERFPRLLGGARDDATPTDPDAVDDFFETELDFGLQTVLDGIARLVEKHS